MLNFTVGPVQSCDEVRAIGSKQVPYFRTDEFSQIMLENERLLKKFAGADDTSRAVFLTGSGTAAMEASIINFFTNQDKILIINGGSFGQRFVNICKVHRVNYDDINLNLGENITESILSNFDKKGYTALLVNIHETSTGVLYNLDLIANFCKKNNMFLLVDAISAFLADNINMQNSNIDAMIVSSQKALACPPGISAIIMNKKALQKIEKNETKCFYLDLKTALLNAERGQTPFTPAVSILLQINARLKQIERAGGVQKEIERVHAIAEDFREKVKNFPFNFVSLHMSNAVTALSPKNGSAYKIFSVLKDKYSIWVCPNGGNLKDKIFRVGHIGFLTQKDNDQLIKAFLDMEKNHQL